MSEDATDERLRLGGWHDPDTIRYGTLLLLLLTSFFVSGIRAEVSDIIVWILNTAIVVSAFRLTRLTDTPTKMAIFCVVAALAFALGLATEVTDHGRGWAYMLQFLMLIVLWLGLLVSILRRSTVDGQTFVGSAAAYFLIGLAFSWVYLAIDVWDDDQLNLDPADTADYPEFSFVVMTTIGFGNQLPTANLAARLVVVEVLIAQLFLATFVARMVSLYGRGRPRMRREPDADAQADDPAT